MRSPAETGGAATAGARPHDVGRSHSSVESQVIAINANRATHHAAYKGFSLPQHVVESHEPYVGRGIDVTVDVGFGTSEQVLVGWMDAELGLWRQRFELAVAASMVQMPVRVQQILEILPS
jgi:hypothetical protein